MNPVLEATRAKRDKTQGKLDELLAKPTAEARALTDDEAAKFTERSAQITELDAQIKELEAERDEIKAEVLFRMGEAATAKFAAGEFELVRQARHRGAYEVKASDYSVLMQRKVKK